jgi:hypothetical protein
MGLWPTKVHEKPLLSSNAGLVVLTLVFSTQHTLGPMVFRPCALRNPAGRVDARLNGLEVREHVLEFRQVGRRFIPTHCLEPFPKIEDDGILVGAGDGFLRNPLENLDNGPTRRAHYDRRAFGYETLRAKRREVVANQFKQRFLATGPRLVTGD